MFFRRLVLASLLVGLVSGLFLTLAQQWRVAPIIFAAEVLEVETKVVEQETGQKAEQQAADEMAGHGHGDDHHHDTQAWAPEDGGERFFYSGLSNVLAAIGFSALLLATMAQLQLSGTTRLTALKGLLWGSAGFVAFFVAPSLGLPPEIPGVEAAVLENRQGWWLMTVLSSAAGLAVLAFAPKFAKFVGLVLLAVPHLLGAPHLSGPAFSHPDPQAVQTLISLHAEFIVVSALANAVFWLVLGLLCAWVLNKWLLRNTGHPA